MRFLVVACLSASSVFAASIFYSTGGSQSIPDLGSVTSSIVVPNGMAVGDLNVTVNITHTYDNDLSMWLVDPTGGVSVYLASNVGASGDNFTNTVFDGSASTAIGSGSAPFTGTYRPTGDLSAFNGLNAQGAWTLHVADGVGGDVGTLVSWSMAITPLTTFQSTDVPRNIPDLGTLNSTLTVPYGLAIQDVNVRLSVTHTYDNDLAFWLVNPSGTLTVQLASGVGGSGGNFTNTVFDDSAATAIGSGAAPFTGTYRPVGSLAQFNGTDAGGTWTLRVSDQVGGDAGSLNSWSLDFVGDVTAPEPSTFAALASGLLLAALGRKVRP